MGVRKFRSVDAMPGPPAAAPLDPENLRLAFGLMTLGALRPLTYEPGVRKFRSWDALLEWRNARVLSDR
jgi:hypothetical protein